MPLSRSLPDIQRDLRQLLTDDLKAVLDQLQALLPENAPKQDEIFLLLGRYNDARRLERQGTATGGEVRHIENQLRRDLLTFINELTEADFDPAAQKNKPGGAKQGMLLYQVPHLMTLEEETRCTVRIALDRDVLFDDLKIIDHTEERLLKKISKSMQVELADPQRRAQLLHPYDQ